MGKSAFDWDVYKNRKSALQHLKRTSTRADVLLETEDGSAKELVHSQVISALSEPLFNYVKENGAYVRDEDQNQQRRDIVQQLDENQGQQAAARGSRWPGNGRVKLIRLPKINKYTLDILIDCAYTGFIRTDLPSGGIWQVLEVAEHYSMADVIRACCAFLVKNLDRSNCVRFYHIGIRHRHALQRCAWHKIRANFKHILEQDLRLTGGQRDTSQRPVAQLATIRLEHFEPLLMHDKLNIDNEETVWHAIKLWCNHNLSERSGHISRLLPCMRFPRFRTGTDFSQRFIWRDPLVLNDKPAQHQLAVLDRNHRDFLAGGHYHHHYHSPQQSQQQQQSSQYPRHSTLLSSHLPAAGSNSLNLSSALMVSSSQQQQPPPARDGFSLPCAASPRQLRPRVPHSILLAIGGWQQGQPTTLIESYDVNCNMWFISKRRIMTPLAYHGIECINGLLYVCGGTDGTEILNEVFTFDPVRGDCQQRPSMREARCYVSTAHLGNSIYAIGGHNGMQRMKSVERAEVHQNSPSSGSMDSWAHVRDMNVARSDASACVHEQNIYIAGGLNDQVIESSVEFYNPADDTWTFASSMLTPRTSFTLLLYRGNLLAIGGNNGTERLQSVEQYDFRTKLWLIHSQMRHKRSTFSAALVDENKLIVVGGYNGQTPFSQVEMYDEQLGQWVLLQKIRYDRSGLRVVVVNDLPNATDYTFLGSTGQFAPTAIELGSNSPASASSPAGGGQSTG